MNIVSLFGVVNDIRNSSTVFQRFQEHLGHNFDNQSLPYGLQTLPDLAFAPTTIIKCFEGIAYGGAYLA